MESGRMSAALMVLAAVLVVLVGKLIAAVVKARQRYVRVKKLMEEQGIPGPPPPSWIAGNALESNQAIQEDMPSIDHNFAPHIWPYHVKCLREYGNKYLTWNLGLQPVLHVADAQVSFEVQSKVSERPEMFRRVTDSVFGKGIFNAPAKQWVGHRAQLNPAFHPEKIKNMVKTMVGCVNVMVEDWENKLRAGGGASVEIETHESMVQVTADIIGETAFGTKGEVNKKCVHILSELQDQIMRQAAYATLIPAYRYFPTKDNRLGWKLDKELYTILSEIILSRLREAPADSSFFGDDMLGLLLSATVPADRRKIDMTYLVDELKNFYLAGHETSAHLLTWAMLLLALHPEWQQKAREEVRGLEGRHTEELNKLKIVGMIMTESLRLYSIAPEIVRETIEDIQVNSGSRKITIPKGMWILIDSLTIHQNKDLWGDDAGEFKPERFASQTEGGSGKYLPFGLGPRMCLGRAYALIEMKLVMAMILDKFEWKLSPTYRHAPRMRFTVYPGHGMPLIVSRAA